MYFFMLGLGGEYFLIYVMLKKSMLVIVKQNIPIIKLVF